MFTYKDTIQKKLTFVNYESRLKKEFDYLLKYIELNSARIETTTEELKKSLQKEIEDNPIIESQIFDFYETKLKSIISYYYHSSITLVHSFVENQLIVLCDIIKEQTKNKFDISTLKGSNYIDLSFKYLMLTTSLSEELLNRHKPRISKFQKLRNKIIHENSTYKNEDDRKNLLNDFGNKIDFNVSEKKFYLKSDQLSKEYLSISYKLIKDILTHLKSIDFNVPHENVEKDMPF